MHYMSNIHDHYPCTELTFQLSVIYINKLQSYILSLLSYERFKDCMVIRMHENLWKCLSDTPLNFLPNVQVIFDRI